MNSISVIAAVRTCKELEMALQTDVSTVFMLVPNIETLKAQADAVHRAGKKLFVHIDLAEGIGKDEYGIRFAASQGVDGIISTRTNIIKLAKKQGLYTVQRFFIMDSHSVDTTVDTAASSKADMIEIMPGVVPKVIQKLKTTLDVPIIAGGLIESEQEVYAAHKSGASAVSVGKKELWRLK